MNAEAEDYYSLSTLFSHLKYFLGSLLKKWWLILLFAVLGVLAGLFYYFLQKPKYEAVSTFILEERSSVGGGLTGLASQFGFDVGSLGAGGGIFTGDNILDILRSKKIAYEVLLSKVDSQKSETLADLFINSSEIGKKWSAHKELKTINFLDHKKNEPLTQKQDSLLNQIHEYILNHGLSAERLNKKGSIIKVQVTSSNSTFARLTAERLVNEAAKLYLDIKTGTAQTNIEKLQRKSDSLLLLLNRKSFTTAASQPLDINPGIRTAIVPVEIATRDKSVLATIYAEVTKNLEASRLILSQQTPVIQLLDQPGVLLDDNKKGIVLLTIVGGIASTLMYILIAFAIFLLKTMAKQNEHSPL